MITRKDWEEGKVPIRELEEMFDEFLDDITEPVDILGIKYDVSRVLKEIDPIMYEAGMDEFFDNFLQEAEEVLEDYDDDIDMD
tara:strand:+ start:4248 stop:4496 length:249 start_codon:yes stop_codon:yes gene_type:complete